MRVLRLRHLDPGPLAKALDKVCAAIERDDLRSPDVRKLHGAPLHRARLNDRDRVLLQFLRHQGETVCLVLEIIVRHAYDKSRFLRGATVQEAELAEAFDAATVAPPEAPRLRYLHPTRAEFRMLDKPLSFDDAQEAALGQRPPLIVVGSAGSGKTALLLQALRDAAGRHVAYITESRWLAETARSLYIAHGGAPEEQEIAFLSLMQLVESIAVPSAPLATWAEFKGFFHEQMAGNRTLREAGAHAVFEELRGVLSAEPEGAFSREQYRALGVKQSLFPPEQRDAVYDCYLRYCEWLLKVGRSDPNLLAHALLERADPVWDFVCIDEVQDLTNVQLALILRTLKPHGSFVLAGDANQIVHPNYFSWGRVKSLFWRGRAALDESRQVHLLAMSYRNSMRVTEAANRLLALKVLRHGSIDRESNRLMDALPGDEGATLVLQSGSKGARDLADRCRSSSEVAVLVLRDEHKEDARRLYRTPLVFSIHEAKGLEYRTVVLHRLVTTARTFYADLAAGVRPEELDREQLDYRRARDKADKSLETGKFYINALYVALTRAIHDVIAVEDDPRHPLLALLKMHDSDSAAAVSVRKTSREEWQREASKLEAQGKAEQAAAIRREVLGEKKVPWAVYNGAVFEECLAKASQPSALNAKTREQLREFAYFHGDPHLLARLEALVGGRESLPTVPSQLHDVAWRLSRSRRGGPDPRPASQLWKGIHLSYIKRGDDSAWNQRRPQVVEAAVRRCAGKSLGERLRDTESFGVDHRLLHGVTQLMMAAYRNDLPWVAALMDRGATLSPRDHAGRQAVHWAWMGALERKAPASLGPLWELVAPAAFDIEVDGHALQIGREMAEYPVFQRAMALTTDALCAGTMGAWPAPAPAGERLRDGFDFEQLTAKDHLWWPLMSAAVIGDGFWEGLPPNVVPEHRKRGTYLNHVMARAEVDGTYRPARKLWRRVDRGLYVLSSALRLRERDADGAEVWRPLDEVLGLRAHAERRRKVWETVRQVADQEFRAIAAAFDRQEEERLAARRGGW